MNNSPILQDAIFCKMNENDINEIYNIPDFKNDKILSKTSLINSAELPNSLYFVVKKQNCIIGYIGATLLYDHIDIDAVMVKSDFKKKGVATYMLNNIFQIALSNDIHDVFLEVKSSNKPAISLYEKLGFINISIRKNYYVIDNSKGLYEDALVYVKNLR